MIFNTQTKLWTSFLKREWKFDNFFSGHSKTQNIQQKTGNVFLYARRFNNSCIRRDQSLTLTSVFPLIQTNLSKKTLQLWPNSYLNKESMEEALIQQYKRSNYDPMFFAFFSDSMLQEMGTALCLNENWSEYESSSQIQKKIFLETVSLALEMLMKKLDKKTLKNLTNDLGINESEKEKIPVIASTIIDRYVKCCIWLLLFLSFQFWRSFFCRVFFFCQKKKVVYIFYVLCNSNNNIFFYCLFFFKIVVMFSDLN